MDFIFAAAAVPLVRERVFPVGLLGISLARKCCNIL
jgi:hypothetical protein